MLWNPGHCRDFAKRFFLDDVYDSYDSLTKKINLGRYLITCTYGGCFVDTDTKCYKSLNGLFDSDKVHLVTEPKSHTFYVMNGFYYTPKESEFFQDVIANVGKQQRCHSTYENGPGYLNRLLRAKKYDVIIHEDDNELFVWHKPELVTDKTIAYHHNQSCR
jgi:mannosyltransferase OCH1-like enzyme